MQPTGTGIPSTVVKKKPFYKRKVVLVGMILLIVIIAVVVVLTASVNQVTKPDITSATIHVTCSGCVAITSLGNYTFSGAIDNGGSSTSVQSTNSTTSSQDFSITRVNTNSVWIISFSFQKNSQPGTLEVKVTLNTGQVVFDQNTSANYGVVAGSYSTASS